MSTLQLLSTMVLALIAAGVATRQRTRLHMSLMIAAFAIDLALVVYIEVTRHAVERVGASRPIVWFHVAVSVAVLVLYVVQLTLGRAMLTGRATSRRLHAALGITFCLCRGINYVTSLVVASHPAALQQAAIVSAPDPAGAHATPEQP